MCLVALLFLSFLYIEGGDQYDKHLYLETSLRFCCMVYGKHGAIYVYLFPLNLRSRLGLVENCLNREPTMPYLLNLLQMHLQCIVIGLVEYH